MLGKLIPWLDADEDESRRLRGEAAAVRREQQALAPLIDAQTRYLVRKAEINGFSDQLRGLGRNNAG